MKKETFLYLCRDLAIRVSKRIVIALWSLATGMDYRSIGQLFGVGLATCCKITHNVSDTLVNVLLKRFIAIVAKEQVQETKEGFRITSGLPQCVGAIDGCHIPYYE